MEDESVDQAEFAKAVGSGRQFADRVRTERLERGWSQAELARRMRAIGQPLDQAAISKIESPPASDRTRRIDIDEAIGFARVFGLSLEQMTIPLASPAELSALRVLANSARYAREYHGIQRAYMEAVRLVAVAAILFPAVAAQLNTRRLEASSSIQSGERRFITDVDDTVAKFRESDRPLAFDAFSFTNDFDDDTLRALLLKQLQIFEWPNGASIGPVDFQPAPDE